MLTITPVAVAFAADASSGGAGGIISFAPIIVLFAIFYFLMIRPQQKRAKAHKEMLSKTAKGDFVVTTGGLHGRVTAVSENTVTIEVADNVRVKVEKNAIAKRMVKGEKNASAKRLAKGEKEG